MDLKTNPVLKSAEPAIPIVLVSGFGHNTGAHFLPKDAALMHQQGPLFGWQSLGSKAELIRRQISAIINHWGGVEVVAHSLGCLLAAWAITQLPTDKRDRITKLTLVAPTGFYFRRRFLTAHFLFGLVGVSGFLAALAGLLLPWRGARVPARVAKRLYGHTHSRGELCSDSAIAFIQLILGLYRDPLSPLLTSGFDKRRIRMIGGTLDACVHPDWVRFEAELFDVSYEELQVTHCGYPTGFPF